MARTFSTKDLAGTRVVGGKKGTKRIGKVRRFVFHPTEKRCVGFIVKRPDLLLMFRRKDLFVPLDGFEMEDGRVRLLEDMPQAYGPAAIRRLGLDWDNCTLWQGMPILTVSGEDVGLVGDIVFQQGSGKVVAVEARRGSVDKALLGTKTIPAQLVRGFKLGVGATIVSSDATRNMTDEQLEEQPTGAILVDDAVAAIQGEGGAAERAGQATARAKAEAKDAAERARAAAAPKVAKAAKEADDAVQKGSHALGRQLGRATGMFGAFKEEYEKARHGE